MITELKPRMLMGKVDPKAYKAMGALKEYLDASVLKKSHFDLIYTFSSVLNGCAYCIQAHTKDAMANGETPKRLFALNAWKESPYFDKEEKTVLELTEQVTFISHHQLTDEMYNNAVAILGEQYVATVIMAISTINVWNRIGIATKMLAP